MLATGLVLVPSGLVMMVVVPVSARISRAREPRVTLMFGTALVALVIASLIPGRSPEPLEVERAAREADFEVFEDGVEEGLAVRGIGHDR